MLLLSAYTHFTHVRTLRLTLFCRIVGKFNILLPFVHNFFLFFPLKMMINWFQQYKNNNNNNKNTKFWDIKVNVKIIIIIFWVLFWRHGAFVAFFTYYSDCSSFCMSVCLCVPFSSSLFKHSLSYILRSLEYSSDEAFFWSHLNSGMVSIHLSWENLTWIVPLIFEILFIYHFFCLQKLTKF